MQLELISFPICPYVQRSVITLLYKNVPFRLTHIDLANKPDWFLAISPLGKVPVLRVDEETVIFESAVINEFIDETTSPRLHPEDPIRRAHNRSWIEFGSTLLVDMYYLMAATDEAGYQAVQKNMMDKLGRLEAHAQPRPYFNGEKFSLVDAAIAPFFMRLELANKIRPIERWPHLNKLNKWSQTLMQMPAVRDSVSKDFEAQYSEYLKARGSFMVK